jgi:carbon-monoxide dehydrogenase iron sulfur subunit
MKVLVFKPELCEGQRACEGTCSQTWFKEVNPNKSAIRISESSDASGCFQAKTCTQCGKCMDVCPTMAISRDRRGIVRIDKDLCVGCLACVGFCPYGAMFVQPDNLLPFKCVVNGSCVKTCPTGALSVEDLADAEPTATEMRMKAVV